MNSIICPHCGETIEINQAITKQLEQEITAREKEKHRQDLEEVRKTALAESTKKAAEQFELQMKHLSEDKIHQEERNKELLDQITELTKQMREVKREKDEAKLEMEKKLAIEEEKIRLLAQKKAEEEQHSKIAEKDKQLSDALREIEEMKRKLQQGSQQTQGEAFELEFESLLEATFRNDKIEPVGKGVRGGDIIQEVWDSQGNYNGKILWELKNTKAWSEQFAKKLRDDKRTLNANEAVIVSDVLPADIKIAGYHDAVWVTQRAFALTLASTIRANLINLRIAKQSVQAKDNKMEIMYSYLSGVEFKHRVEAIVEAFTNMREEIEKERRYFNNKWARDEKNIRMVIDNTYGMHGDLKAIIGRMLPQIKGLDIVDYDTKGKQLELTDEENDSKTNI